MRLRWPSQSAAVIAVLAGVVASAVLSPSGVGAGEDTPRVAEHARLVVLLDESGSLSESDVQREREAAALMALAQLSPDTEMAVAGFGSSNGPGQSAVHVYCGLTSLVELEDRLAVLSCIDSVHRRAPSEGYDTDHAEALEVAIDLLEQSDAGTGGSRSVIFLLTDGRLEVARSPQYGTDVDRRNEFAMERITDELLPRARRASIQVWPLGFGSADAEQLARFAAGGDSADPNCGDPEGTTPRAVVVTEPRDVLDDLLNALASAECGLVVAADPPILAVPDGGVAEQVLVIPSLATDVTFTVLKGTGSVSVDFITPTGLEAPSSGEVDGQAFERLGEGGPIETLRVRDPIPGPWTVRFTAAGAGATVEARAIWRGSVTAVVDLDPYRPRQGEQMVAEVVIRTRRGVIVDPAAFASLRVSADVSLGGQSGVRIDMSDDGMHGDRIAADGVFSSQVVLPDGFNGPGEITTRVEGAGLDPVSVSVGFVVDPPDALVFSVTLHVEAPSRLRADVGAVIQGELQVVNEGSARLVRLGIADVSQGATVSVLPTEYEVGPGGQTVPVSITVGEHLPIGSFHLLVQVRTTDDQLVRDQALVVLEVVSAPPFPWWIVFALGLVLVIVSVGSRRWVVAGRLPVHRIKLSLDGAGVSSNPLRATVTGERRDGGSLVFELRKGEGGYELHRSPRSGKSFVMTRDRSRALHLRSPNGSDVVVRAGETVEEVGGVHGLRLLVAETKSMTDRGSRKSRLLGQKNQKKTTPPPPRPPDPKNPYI